MKKNRQKVFLHLSEYRWFQIPVEKVQIDDEWQKMLKMNLLQGVYNFWFLLIFAINKVHIWRYVFSVSRKSFYYFLLYIFPSFFSFKISENYSRTNILKCADSAKIIDIKNQISRDVAFERNNFQLVRFKENLSRLKIFLDR